MFSEPAGGSTGSDDVVGELNGTNIGITFEDDAVRGPVAYFNGEAYGKLPQFVNGLTEITIATWFRMDEVRIWSRIYTFGTGDQSEPKDVLMVIPTSGNNGMYRFTLSNPGSAWYDIDFPEDIVSLELETWYYSVVVLKPDSIILYHNDTQIFAESGYDRAFGTINDVENAIGKSFWPDPLWKGALSDLRVYNTALSQAEVEALYNETLPTGISRSQAGANVPVIYSKDKQINVKLDNSRNDEVVSVYNVTGALVARKPVTEIQSVSFNTGVYIVRVAGSQVNYATKVFVK